MSRDNLGRRFLLGYKAGITARRATSKHEAYQRGYAAGRAARSKGRRVEV